MYRGSTKRSDVSSEGPLLTIFPTGSGASEDVAACSCEGSFSGGSDMMSAISPMM